MGALTDQAYNAFRAAQALKLTSMFSSWRTNKAVNILNPNICEKALDKLDLSAYKNSIIIDMNPGVSVWSAALHDRVKPRQHILLEPEDKYKPYLKEFIKKRPNAYWVPVDGYLWTTYFKLFEPNPPSPPWPKNPPVFDAKFMEPEEGVNTDLLFTGNLSGPGSSSDRLLAQFIAACAHRRWVQKYGRVRFLVWTQDTIKVRYVPRGLGGRGRATVMADTVCEVQEVASSGEILHGKGHPRIMSLIKDEHGNMVLPEKTKKTKPSIGEKVEKVEKEGVPAKKVSVITLKEITEKLEMIEKSRYDKSIAEELKIEIRKEKRGRPRKAETPTSAPTPAPTRASPRASRSRSRDAPSLIPEIESLRKKMLKLKKDIEEEKGGQKPLKSTDELPTLIKKLNQFDRAQAKSRAKLEKQLVEHFSDSEVGNRWLEGMEHPPWYYKDRIPALAQSIMADKQHNTPKRGGCNIRTLATKNWSEIIGSLERPEEVDPPKSTEEAKENYQSYKAQWGKRSDHHLAAESREDEIVGYEKKLVQYYNRKFDSVTVQADDFWPSVPLALLDFTPKLIHPFLNSPDPTERLTHWETFSWMICSLFALRAHKVGPALNTLVPGGIHILDNIDPKDAKVDPMQTIRTLSSDEIIAITKAWDTWPFKVEGAHLEQYMGDEEREDGKKPRITTIR